MGITAKLVVRDLEAINFDKLVLLTLKVVHVHKLSLDEIEVVSEVSDPYINVDVWIASLNWPTDRRSMTEFYALQEGLGTRDASGHVLVASPIIGLPSMCQALAKNHGKMPGVKGGYLYERGMIANVARNLPMLRDEAPALIVKLMRAIDTLLRQPDAQLQLFALSTDPAWSAVTERLGRAEQAVCEEARKLARVLNQDGQCAAGDLFNLKNGRAGELGLFLETRNPNLMKHLWSSFRGLDMKVALALVCHPDTKRIAILTAQHSQVDVQPIADMLTKSYPGAEFDVNLGGGRIIWDPRFSKKAGPTPADVKTIVALHAAFSERQHQPERRESMRASIGDRIKTTQPEVTFKKRS